MAKVEGAVVGAGTVLNERDLEVSVQAGARFIVSPGLTEALSKKALASGIPFLPGIATAGDIMRGLDMGLSRFKFFPAVAAGGIPDPKGTLLPLPAMPLLSDRRHHSGERGRVARARRGSVRGRKLARPSRRPRSNDYHRGGQKGCTALLNIGKLFRTADRLLSRVPIVGGTP